MGTIPLTNQMIPNENKVVFFVDPDLTSRLFLVAPGTGSPRAPAQVFMSFGFTIWLFNIGMENP